MIPTPSVRTLVLSAMTVGAASMAAIAGRPRILRSLSDQLRHGPGTSNHPVGVRPSRAVRIPPDWPLDGNGSVGCITCHTRLPSLAGGVDAALRGSVVADPGEFCANCHQDTSERSMATMHWLATEWAHVGSEEPGGGGSAGILDAASRSCLECHDGVSAAAAGHGAGSLRGSGAVGDRSRSHPIGVAYPRSGDRFREVPLRPTALLPDAVRLPGGRVSCVSCHDVYNSAPARLTVPIEGSRLCLTCHEMD